MIDLHRILVAVDDSEWTGPVLEVAGRLARAFAAQLTVIHGEQLLPPPYFTERGVTAMKAILDDERQAAAAWLRATAGAHLGDLPFTADVVDAPPVAAVMDSARATGADVVVLGTHGRTGLNRLLLGSVAERLLRECDRPLLTVRWPHDGAGLWPEGPRRVLCPVNFRDVSRQALAWAHALAHRFDAELVVLHAIEGDGEEGDVGTRLRALCAEDAQRCAVRTQVRRGEASAQVLDAAAAEAADLIVIGAEHRPLMGAAVLGTTSVRVVRHAVTPVLTVTAGPQR